MSVLLDANVLIALAVENHDLHGRATVWFAGLRQPFATCAITQGALLRVLLAQQIASNAGEAWALLERIQSMRTKKTHHEFWHESENFLNVPNKNILGHKQVTDAYLAHLARARSASIATFDRGLFVTNPDCAILLS
jgi:uncharacterized protein